MVNLVRASSTALTFVETLKHFSEGGVLVDIFLRSFSLDFELPKDLREKTRCVRIIQVSRDCLAVGPKRPLVTAVIPFEEIATIAISSETCRPDEEEIDRKIEKECPTWERNVAVEMESARGNTTKVEDPRTIQTLDAFGFWDEVKGENYAVVDVFAPWCQPCKEVAAIFGELIAKFGRGVLFAKLDGDENDELTDELDISAYPTVLLFKDGELKKKIEGARSIECYTRELERLTGSKKQKKNGKWTLKANGKVNVLSSEDLMEVLDNVPASVIMFYERGNYECQLQARAMNELAGEYRKKVIFVKVDVDAEDELVELFEVKNTPRVYLVHEGEILSYADDRLTKSELREGIEDLLRVAT